MQFNVAHLLKGSVGTSERHILDLPLVPLEDTQTDQVRGRLSLTRVIDGVWVSGELQVSAVCGCSRCLQDFPISVQFQLDEIYSPVVDVKTGVRLSLPEEAEPNFTVDDHHVLDIAEAVRQLTILATPMKPLCWAECAGICPQCGADRNEVRCVCQSEEIDTGWAPLFNLQSPRRA